MTDLTPVTALGDATARQARFGALRLAERPDVGLASLALRKGGSAPAPFGLVLPGPGKAVFGEKASAYWTGPDQWMIEVPGQGTGDFAAALREVAPGVSITEQTDGFTVFEVTSDSGGASIDALMAKLVNVDPAALGPGRATRTGLHHMTVFLVRRSQDRLDVIAMRSFARALWHALSVAAERLEG